MKYIFFFNFLLLTLWFESQKVFCNTPERQLIFDLFNGYNPCIRPTVSHRIPVNVSFSVTLSQIIDVDEKNMIATASCWLREAWTDQNLKWHSFSYDGITQINLPNEKIWKPDILLVNSMDSASLFPPKTINAVIYNDGSVLLINPAILKLPCIKLNNFDISCSMEFLSWTYDGFLLDLKLNDDHSKIDISDLKENYQWHFVDSYTNRSVQFYECCKEPYPRITYKIILRKRSN